MPVPDDVNEGLTIPPLGYRILERLAIVGLIALVAMIVIVALNSAGKLDPVLVDRFLTDYFPGLVDFAQRHSDNLPEGPLGLLATIVAVPSFAMMIGGALLRDKLYPGLSECIMLERAPDASLLFHTQPMRILGGILAIAALRDTPVWVNVPAALGVYAFLPQIVERWIATLPEIPSEPSETEREIDQSAEGDPPPRGE